MENVYIIQWEQYMGAGRGRTLRAMAEDWEAGRAVWRACCENKLPTEVRNVVVTYNGEVLDPTQPWPRPTLVPL